MYTHRESCRSFQPLAHFSEPKLKTGPCFEVFARFFFLISEAGNEFADIDVFTIEITKQYRLAEWHEDIKHLFEKTGVSNKSTTFLFNDTQLKEQGFLEDINNILNSGEVPNLYGKDELPTIYDGVRKRALDAGLEGTPSELWSFFVECIRSNLHLVLAMSTEVAS